MRRALASALFVFPALLAAQTPSLLPSLVDATRIHDTKADAARSWPELLDALAKVDVVFLGETHVDDTTHRVELHVLEQLLARKQGKVVLAMEMFERDAQAALDDYLAGRSDEATFRKRARPWGNYDTAYRPLVEAAKAAKIPVVAANFPLSLRRALGGGGKAAFDALKPEQRALAPAEIFPASNAYWERVDRATRGHMGSAFDSTPEDRLFDTQNLWDNAMGDSVAKARAAHPDSLVLLVAGGFHVAYRDGTVAQFVRRSPGSTFAVVQVAPAGDLHAVRPDRDREQADFVVYARSVAREENDGNWAVDVPGEVRYRLELPDGGVDRPLLVWLPDRTTRIDDAVATWRAAVGDGAALVVVEPPFPELQDDLALGGRYAFGDGFRADYSRTAAGVARIVEYVTRKFAIDRTRIVVAGAGDGGAAVLWTALYGEWVAADFVAIAPNDLTRLGMEGLPDQTPVAKSLHVVAADPEHAQVKKLVADHGKVGTPTTASAATADRGVALLRERLGLAAIAAPGAGKVVRLQLAHDSARARDWQELHRLALAGAGHHVEVLPAGAAPAGDDAANVRRLVVGGDGPWPVASFAEGRGLPLAGGPFGGTTVVVLPADVSDTDRAAWLDHEKNRVLKRRSMFANIAVACAAGSPSLPEVVAALKAKGRSRLLIVPAQFCADATTMRTLRDQLGDAAAGLDVAWLPGLGAELARSSPR